MPIQRERINAAISKLQEESLADLVEGLSDLELYDNPGVLSGDLVPQDDFELVLSNRRTIKLWALLQEMPESDRRKKSKQIFDRMSSAHRDLYDRKLKRFEVPDAPRVGKSSRASQMALCSAIFLLSRCCDAGTMVEAAIAVSDFEREVLTRLQNPVFSDGDRIRFRSCLVPDNAFQLNVLLYALQQSSDLPRQDREKLADALAPLKPRKIPIVPWSAATTHYDIPHRFGGIPMDKSKGVTFVTFYEWGNLAYQEENQIEMIEMLRDLLMKRGLPDVDKASECGVDK